MTMQLRDRFRDAPSLRSVASQYQALPRLTAAPLVTRFAPSPTGELHLGHVVHALWVWGVAEVLGAKVVVRMEDHDRTRCRDEFEQAILADLAWLGFEGEPTTIASLEHHPSDFRQSDHPERYATALITLQAATDVYGCICTRAQLGPADVDRERRYPGTCRGMPISRGGRSVIRARLPDEMVPTTDLRLGPLEENPQPTCGDVVVQDALGQWSYQFSVVVDDMVDGVDLVVRGEDLVHSTARQAALGKLLGRPAPLLTLHHPVVTDETGRKLSKRDRSLTVRAMRESGKRVEEILAGAWEVAGLDR